MKALKEHPICRGVAVIVMALMTLTTTAPIARAASHREAPLIALDPAADDTDTMSSEVGKNPSKVVFIMNVIPGQDPATVRTISTSMMKSSTLQYRQRPGRER